MVLNMGSDFSVAFLITCNYTIFQKQLILIFVQCTYTVMAAELIQILNFVCSILLYSRILYQCTTPMHWDRADCFVRIISEHNNTYYNLDQHKGGLFGPYALLYCMFYTKKEQCATNLSEESSDIFRQKIQFYRQKFVFENRDCT